MIRNWWSIFRPADKKTAARRVMARLLAIFLMTALITVSFFVSGYRENRGYVLANVLIVIFSATICGFLLGFLFGIPRSLRFRDEKSGGKEESGSYFADNTNLEEISDWITKIIIGLSLVELRKILKMTEHTARNVAASFPPGDKDLFVFSYALLVFFSALGFFGGYFWSRTLLGAILTQSRKEQEDLISLANRNLSNVNEETNEHKGEGLSFDLLKRKTILLLAENPVIDKTDSQKGRWGGLALANGRRLTAWVRPTVLGLYDVTIEVSSVSENPLDKPVVILLDSTFPEDVIYLQPVANKVEVTVVAYEAFTIAALCDDLETRLELDLQQQKGLPAGFYYK